jgi:copper resistance protein D
MEFALALCRFAHFLSAMIVFGASAFAWLLAPEALRRVLSPGLRRLTIALSVVILVSAAVWLALEAGAMGGEWRFTYDAGVLKDVLLGTAFGEVWQARIALAIALAAILAFGSRDRWALATCLAAAVVASLGLVGHAAMQDGALGMFHRANDALHLLAASAWLGGLAPFLLCLKAYENEDRRRDAVTAMTRFSISGHFIVMVVIASGAVNIALTTHAVPLPPTSPYRALLLTKIALVAAMISIALFNRYVLVPRIEPGGPSLRALRWTCLGEVGLASLIVGLVSVFGLLDPV